MWRTSMAAALVLTVACSAGDDEAKATNTTEEASETTSTTAATTTTTLLPPLGAKHDNHGGTVVPLRYEQPTAPSAPGPVEDGYPDGYVWAGLDVEVCVPSAPDEYAVAGYLWHLNMPDHSVIETASVGYDRFPQPTYPVEQRVSPGQCVRGWIVFPVPGNSRPVSVSYAPSEGSPLLWAIPSA